MKRLISLIFGLLLLVEVCGAATFVNEGSFHRVFSGKDYYTTSSGSKVDFTLQLSTMSSNGEVVAFYGDAYFDSISHRKLFIHNFEATTEPIEVTLPVSIGNFNVSAGMVSNADGSRIFFTASKLDAYSTLFCMLNGLTGEVTILLDATSGIAEEPTCIATDANGDYLYFNETDNGDRGDLWRIPSSGGAPVEIILAATIGHPSGGVVRFIDDFSVSDDGQTIAFFVEGLIETDGTVIRTNKELFVKTVSGIRFITDNDQNGKKALVLSGDGSTIVYTRNYEWMVTTPDAVVEGQVQIEEGFYSTGARAGISTDGSIVFASSSPNGESSPEAYLIQTDGSGRKIIGPGYTHLPLGTTSEGYHHLSGDGKRICFKNRKYIYPDEWYNITVGIFDKSFWTSEVPNITSVNYASDMLERLENDERFDITIGVSDPQGNETIMDLDEIVFLPNGYEAKGGEGPISVLPLIEYIDDSLYTTEGERGTGWPSYDPVTVRFSVEDEDGNFGYADTVIGRDSTIFSDDFESSDTGSWS